MHNFFILGDELLIFCGWFHDISFASTYFKKVIHM